LNGACGCRFALPLGQGERCFPSSGEALAKIGGQFERSDDFDLGVNVDEAPAREDGVVEVRRRRPPLPRAGE
jgi:hypothetical protein